MKRLLLGPALALPLILGFCSFHKPELPKLPSVLRGAVSTPEVVTKIPLDDFNQFAAPPTQPKATPAPKHQLPVKAKPHHQVKHHGPIVLPPVPQAPAADVEPEPDPPVIQRFGLTCAFPFGMFPNCKPGVP